MLGEAISKNPGYLKLRKLKASREIARTVSEWRHRFLDYFSFLRAVF
jgi:hypothetical protein